MRSIRRTPGAEPPQVWRAADGGGPPAHSSRRRRDPARVVLRRRRWAILCLAVLAVALLALNFTVSDLLLRGLFTATAVLAVLLAAFLAAANAPATAEPVAAAGRPVRRGRGQPGGAAAGTERPDLEVRTVETAAERGPATGDPAGAGPRQPEPAQQPYLHGLEQPPAPAHAQPQAPAPAGAPPHRHRPATPPADPYAQAPADGTAVLAPAEPARPDGQPAHGTPPATGAAGEPGRFPVLRKPSPAATAPWRLPAAPSAAGISADEAVLGGLRLRAASVSGPSHRSRGIPRQDAYRIGQDSAGRHLVVAVADGMSDSAHSDIGASAAVIALVNTLRELLDRGVPLAAIEVREVFLAAARQMYGAADQRGWTGDEVRAVALAAVVPAQPDPDGVRRCWLGAVGDVSAWRLVRERWERLIGDEKGGLDPSAVSTFLPHCYEHPPYGIVELRPGEVMALTSDGVADAFALGAEAQGWFAERWRQPPPVGAFLLHVGFEQAQFHDDRTAVVVWCDSAADTPAQGRRR